MHGHADVRFFVDKTYNYRSLINKYILLFNPNVRQVRHKISYWGIILILCIKSTHLDSLFDTIYSYAHIMCSELF